MTAAAPRSTFGLRRPAGPLIEAPAPAEPEERFVIPVEMALYQANATGQMFLRRAREMGATYRKRAVVWRVGERLLARIDFLTPVGPEKWCEQVVQLSPLLWESVT